MSGVDPNMGNDPVGQGGPGLGPMAGAGSMHW